LKKGGNYPMCWNSALGHADKNVGKCSLVNYYNGSGLLKALRVTKLLFLHYQQNRMRPVLLDFESAQLNPPAFRRECY
jgi:hypothetical protein